LVSGQDANLMKVVPPNRLLDTIRPNVPDSIVREGDSIPHSLLRATKEVEDPHIASSCLTIISHIQSGFTIPISFSDPLFQVLLPDETKLSGD
jgi:hypothetical protein